MTEIVCETILVAVDGNEPPQIAARILLNYFEDINSRGKNGSLAYKPRHEYPPEDIFLTTYPKVILLKKFTTICAAYSTIPIEDFFLQWTRKQENVSPNKLHTDNFDCPDLQCFVSREKDFALAGIDTCLFFTDIDKVTINEDLDSNSPGVQIIGANFFEPSFVNKNDLRVAGYWTVPCFEMLWLSGKLFLSVYLSQISWDTDLFKCIKILRTIRWHTTSQELCRPYTILPTPDEIQQIPIYDTNINRFFNFCTKTLQKKFLEREIEKVVLSRTIRLRFNENINGTDILLAVLNRSPAVAKRSFLIYISTRRLGFTFVSVTPELLCKSEGLGVEMEALAGTWKSQPNLLNVPGRHITVDTDDKLTSSSVSEIAIPPGGNSPILIDEHRIVLDYIYSRMVAKFRVVLVRDPVTLNLGNISHRYQHMSGKYLDECLCDFVLGPFKCGTCDRNRHERYDCFRIAKWALKTIHPTPAICGESSGGREPKLIILKYEEFMKFSEFSLYRSAIGVISSRRCELAIGIRCAHFTHDKRELTLHGGSGLLRHSEPDKEWTEQLDKLSFFLNAFLNPKEIDLLRNRTTNPNHVSRPLERIFRLARPALIPLTSHLDFNIFYCSVIIDELRRHGVDHYVICPGSRSAPLALAVTRNLHVSSHVFVDERGGGFYGVGYARATQGICAVIVTSGTAVANLVPAALEAKHSPETVKLLLLTADRPSESRQCGETQTVDHMMVFRELCVRSTDFAPPTEKVPWTHTLSELSHTVALLSSQGGCAHFNFQFREPLTPSSAMASLVEDPMPRCDRFDIWRKISSKPFTAYPVERTFLPDMLVTKFIDNKIVVVVGALPGEVEAKFIIYISSMLDALILADSQSGIRGTVSPDIILRSDCLSNTLSSGTLLLLFGGPVISKRLSRFVQKMGNSPDCELIRISSHIVYRDPDWVIDSTVTLALVDLCECVASRYTKFGPANKIQWKSTIYRFNTIQRGLKSYIERFHGVSEPLIAATLNQIEFSQVAFFIGASMVCRDIDTFAYGYEASFDLMSVRSVVCNRGANGIDGIIASSIGYSVGLKGKRVICLVGDISCIHDMSSISALAMLTHNTSFRHGSTSIPCVLVVCVNNHGCGIFNFLPISANGLLSLEEYDHILDLPHSIRLSDIANAVGLEGHVFSHTDTDPAEHVKVELSKAFSRLVLRDDSSVLEIFAEYNSQENVMIHDFRIGDDDIVISKADDIY